jgi:hypothetical protein
MLLIMNRMKSFRTLWLLSLLCAFVGVVISAACQEVQKRRPSRYLIPEGYDGWIRVNFTVKDAPPLPVEEGYYLFKFPASGLLETSSDLEYGSASDEYYYYSGDSRRKLRATGWGEGGMIWGEYNGSSGNSPERTNVHEGFFVGTEEEFNKYGPLRDENGNPRVGDVKANAASNSGMQRTRAIASLLSTLCWRSPLMPGVRLLR